MMLSTIGVGIVGASVTRGGSEWGAQVHVPILQALTGFELRGVCTRSADTARASAELFGAGLAFTSVEEMASHPDIDLVSVVVRVPNHLDLVMACLAAGKAVFCEWPLGIDRNEAYAMTTAAIDASAATSVGLQGRSDSHIRYARDLLADGFIGRVLAANAVCTPQAFNERGAGRIWQSDRAQGANSLTIAGGHTIDTFCFLVGEFGEIVARVSTQQRTWRDTDTGRDVDVSAPDTVNLTGQLVNDVEVAIQIASVPSPVGSRIEIYGSKGTLILSGGQLISTGPNRLFLRRGSDSASELVPPDAYTYVSQNIPVDRSRNVAQGYVRFGNALRGGSVFDPGFTEALRLHDLIEIIERSAHEGSTIALEPLTHSHDA